MLQEILEILRSQMLSPITPTSLASLRQLANKMEKILLVALESYGNTFVEPKVELGARFGHLVCECLLAAFLNTLFDPNLFSEAPRHLPGYPGSQHRLDQREAAR